MSDLIDRQAAIDAIYETFCYAYCDNCEKEMNEDLCGDCHRKYQNWAASKKTISKTINGLSSAQSEGKTYEDGWREGREALRREIWEDERERLNQQTGGN